MPSIEDRFSEFVNNLSASDQQAVVPLMAEFISAISGPTAQATYKRAAASKGDDMEAYAAMRQPRSQRGP